MVWRLWTLIRHSLKWQTHILPVTHEPSTCRGIFKDHEACSPFFFFNIKYYTIKFVNSSEISTKRNFPGTESAFVYGRVESDWRWCVKIDNDGFETRSPESSKIWAILRTVKNNMLYVVRELIMETKIHTFVQYLLSQRRRPITKSHRSCNGGRGT